MHRSSLITLFFYIYGEKAFEVTGAPADMALMTPFPAFSPAFTKLSS